MITIFIIIFLILVSFLIYFCIKIKKLNTKYIELKENIDILKNENISSINKDIKELKNNKNYFNSQVNDLNYKMKKTIDILETFNNGFPVNQSYKY